MKQWEKDLEFFELYPWITYDGVETSCIFYLARREARVRGWQRIRKEAEAGDAKAIERLAM